MRIQTENGQRPPISCKECDLARFTLCRPTNERSLDLVCARRGEVRAIPAGRTILREGDVPDHVSLLYSGWAICHRQLSDGRRQILSFLVPGDVVTLESLVSPYLPSPFSVKTLTATTSCVFSVHDMVALIEISEPREQELERAQQRYLSYLHARLFDLGRRSARGRLAQLVLHLHERLARREMVSADGSFAFPPRQEHLADALGLTTVYVNRTLAQLRRERILSIERERMTIHDAAELRRIAQEE